MGLAEPPPGSGVFSEDLLLGTGAGRRTVSHGDRVTISYTDLDDGVSGSPVKVTAQIDVDCVAPADRKSTRLNSSHGPISYAVFCLKKKKFLPRLKSPLKSFLHPPTLPPHRHPVYFLLHKTGLIFIEPHSSFLHSF